MRPLRPDGACQIGAAHQAFCQSTRGIGDSDMTLVVGVPTIRPVNLWGGGGASNDSSASLRRMRWRVTLPPAGQRVSDMRLYAWGVAIDVWGMLLPLAD